VIRLEDIKLYIHKVLLSTSAEGRRYKRIICRFWDPKSGYMVVYMHLYLLLNMNARYLLRESSASEWAGLGSCPNNDYYRCCLNQTGADGTARYAGLPVWYTGISRSGHMYSLFCLMPACITDSTKFCSANSWVDSDKDRVLLTGLSVSVTKSNQSTLLLQEFAV